MKVAYEHQSNFYLFGLKLFTFSTKGIEHSAENNEDNNYIDLSEQLNKYKGD